MANVVLLTLPILPRPTHRSLGAMAAEDEQTASSIKQSVRVTPSMVVLALSLFLQHEKRKDGSSIYTTSS